MTQEEKAKAYDEIIKKANKMHHENCEACQACIEELIPELAESEDERIRKNIIKAFKIFSDKQAWVGHCLDDIDWDACIAWLEKQGEHANFRNKIQIGDKVTRNEDGVLVNLSQLNRIAKKDEKQGEKKLVKEHNICDTCDEKYKCVNLCPVKLVEQKSAWSEEDDIMVHDIDYALRCQITYPISRLQSISTWILNLKYRVQLKQEWSEENEKMLEYAIDMIEWYSVIDKNKSRQVSNWLKHLKDKKQFQNIWKPSDEHMDALRYVTNFDYGGYKATLVSLYEQLKRLKEK